MGATSGGSSKGKKKMSRTKERANMSFFIVVMFFAVFGIIVFTEIFLIDERGHGAGVVVRHGSLGAGVSRHRAGDRADYEDVLQNDDYFAIRSGAAAAGGFGGFDDNVGAMLREARGDSAAGGVKLAAMPGISEAELPKLPGGQPVAQAIEAQLPPYPRKSPREPRATSHPRCRRNRRTHMRLLLRCYILNDDYFAIRSGAAAAGGFGGFDDNVGAMLREARGDSAAGGVKLAAMPGISEAELPKLPGGQPVAQAIEAQLPPYPRNLTARDGDWQIVNGTRYKYFVFSAFYDRRKGQQAVRLVGATKTRGPERVWCRLWYRTAENSSNANNANQDWVSVSVMAKVKVIRENWNLKYSACFILCPLHKNLSAPETVSIVSRIRSPPSNLVIVRNTDKDRDMINFTKIPEGIAICVKPFHFNYNRALQLLEFIELNKIMGVTHFTFYNHTIGREADCILRDYIARGTVTLLPWRLNMVSQKEIRTEGLFAALNDCLYRSMYRYSHVALVDLDEYIIPRYNDTLPQLIKWLSTRLNTRTTGSYSFQNAFFYLQWEDDPSITLSRDSVEAGLVTLRKTRRRAKLHPHKQRSKYICRPEFIVEAGNHFVWEFIPGHGTLNVPATAAILHHYRVCEFGGDDCVKTDSRVDTTAYRYKQSLISKVSARFSDLKLQCSLSDLPPPPKKSTTPRPKVVKVFNNANDFSFLSFNAKAKAS